MTAAEPPGVVAVAALPRAHGPAPARGTLRAAPEDFEVEEILGVEPDGEGAHAWLRVRKREANTAWVARELARAAGLAPRAVGYAGLKDRRAVAVQWLSVDLGARPDPDWAAIAPAGVEVLDAVRHRRKLRHGALLGNRFRVTVRDLGGRADAVAGRLEAIGARGVPNYFGEQRFGRDGGNLREAWRMLGEGARVRDRFRRGIYLSAARSLLFNRVAAARVEDGSWDVPLDGDAMQLDGRGSCFAAGDVDAALRERAARGEVHPTGPLWGRGERLASGAARAVEDAALAPCAGWCRGIERAGADAARRALRLRPRSLRHEREGDDALRVTFELPAGGFATTVLREAVDTDS